MLRLRRLVDGRVVVGIDRFGIDLAALVAVFDDRVVLPLRGLVDGRVVVGIGELGIDRDGLVAVFNGGVELLLGQPLWAT